ncbi:MAG: 30S ribosomal protein S9 [Thermoleophilaceae bacterium]|nr:30S ribosomal protein S9 [Thermoleophilaceae bacterium]
MFAEERDPDAGTPENEAPENEAPEGAPGEPGEDTPSPEQDAAVGPEIEGAEALSAASDEAEEAAPDAESDEPPAADEPVAEEASAEGEQPPAEEAAAEEPSAEGEASRERRPKRESGDDKPEEEVIPGMHLEPDLVLEEKAQEENEFGQYAEPDLAEDAGEEGGDEASAKPEPVAHTPLDLAADARYRATGKRKSAVARVILRPGEGTFSVNGRHLDEYFPRVKLQRVARQPLEAAGYNTRLDVVARIHGGGVAAQATALRHGIARALVEADPALRGELKRRGYLTRDPRVKERKKAGLKKARKRPQFSKR